MFDSRLPSQPGTGAPARTEPRPMRVAPLDMRQTRFRTAFRGFDKSEVLTFLIEAADDYEQALREIDRQREELARLEARLGDHRERETNLRNTLLTAQRLADEIKEAAQNEAKLIVREAEGRAAMVLEKTHVRLDEIEREINELRLRRRSVEGSLEASIQALYHALEFIRDQDKPERDEKIRLHRPRQADAPAQPPASGEAARDDRRSGGQG